MNEEEELQKALEEENKRAQEEYDEITKGNELIRKAREGETKDDEQLDIPGLFESRSGVRRGASLAFEIGANTLVDPLSVFDPTGASQYAAGSLINYIAQRIRGGEISAGEMAAAGLASLIPGGAQGKALVKFGKGALKGAASGAIEATSVAAVDEGRLPTVGEFATSTGFGAAFGGALSTPQGAKALKAVQDSIKGGVKNTRSLVNLVKELGATGAPVPEVGSGISPFKRKMSPTPGAGEGSGGKPKKPKIINRKPTLDRSDVEYVPTKSEIKDVMKELGLPEDNQRAAFVAAVFKKDVADIQNTKKLLNDYFLTRKSFITGETNPLKNLADLADAISAQEGVEYTVADLSNIIKNTEATTTRIVKGMPTSNKRIRNLVDLQRILKDRLRKLKQQPTFNKGHANSINNILKKFETGADRPDNIFIEEARSIYSKDAEGKIKLERIGNISKKDIGDDPLPVQRMKGFSPTVQESVLKLLSKQDLELKRVYEGLGIDASDLDAVQNIDISTLVRPELRSWTEETVDDLVKSGVDPEKAVDYLIDINEELGDMLSAAGLREDMFMLFRKEPGLAAQFLNELIGNKKRGVGKLKNIPISDFERQMLASIKDYFKENPLFKVKQVKKTVVKGITKPKPGERREAKKIIKKLPKKDN